MQKKSKMTKQELKDFLDEKVDLYNNPKFIESDPIQIPHLFKLKEDIEIAGFLTSIIAWGNRKMIIKNATKMMELMGNSPYDFVMNHKDEDLKALDNFVHRTFNGLDFIYFMKALRNIYLNHNGLEFVFSKNQTAAALYENIHLFKKTFFDLPHQKRTEKHVSDPFNGSAAKRLNMYLRWMVRPATKGVDFGLWNSIHSGQLSCPLDVHTGNVARALGLLTRKQNDARALAELDQNLRTFDPHDPVKYDFALFGLGAYEGFK